MIFQHGAIPPGETKIEVISKMIAALRTLPPTYGFVDEYRVDEQPSDIEVFEEWPDGAEPAWKSHLVTYGPQSTFCRPVRKRPGSQWAAVEGVRE